MLRRQLLTPAQGVPDDNPELQLYGVRVPAFVVSAWVERGTVSKQTYDHTSLLSTILRRFCVGTDGSVPRMGSRTGNANDLGPLLSTQSPRVGPEAPEIPVPPGHRGGQPDPNAFGVVLRRALFGF